MWTKVLNKKKKIKKIVFKVNQLRVITVNPSFKTRLQYQIKLCFGNFLICWFLSLIQLIFLFLNISYLNLKKKTPLKSGVPLLFAYSAVHLCKLCSVTVSLSFYRLLFICILPYLFSDHLIVHWYAYLPFISYRLRLNDQFIYLLNKLFFWKFFENWVI